MCSAPWWLRMVAMAARPMAPATLRTRLIRPDASFISVTGRVEMVIIWAATMARRAHTYNTRDLPVLYLKWQRSFMCRRCGEVFVAAA